MLVIFRNVLLTSGQAIMFVDNTNLFFNNVSYIELFIKANEELHKANSWLTTNKLTLSTKKTSHNV